MIRFKRWILRTLLVHIVWYLVGTAGFGDAGHLLVDDRVVSLVAAVTFEGGKGFVVGCG